jgi:lipopolysaccharide/colanic/teichoic acid biosynthesis glycosyltransferase
MMAASTAFTSPKVPAAWCFSRRKRLFDVVGASLLMAPAAPLMLLVAAVVQSTSPGPILFRQTRLGQAGRPFELLKFRSMRHSASVETLLTPRGDTRITAAGRWLRAWKLDELPQLLNVLWGEMSLVGPRPDLEDFWKQTDASSRRALELKPGITGAASLAFCDEEELLAQVPAIERTPFYVGELLPQKAELDLEYAARASFRADCMLLLRTVLKVLWPRSD